MSNTNTSVVVGRLVADANVHGKAAYLKVANNRSYKDKDGNWQQATSFITCKLIDSRAQSDAFLARLSKGAIVSVDGRLETYEKKYFEQDGEGFKEVPVTLSIITISDIDVIAQSDEVNYKSKNSSNDSDE